MEILVFRHVPFEHLGLIARALENHGLRYRYVEWFADPEAPAPWQEAAGLIFMGGPMSANDDLPWLRQELRLIEAACQAGKPVLGVCLGAQLIAKAAGARVYPNAVKEIGWAPVYWTEAASTDALFRGLRQPETVFHWHGETFDLPAGAVWLAYTENCRHQAFRLGDSVWGIQFHLEVTPEMIADWCSEADNRADIASLPALPDPYANAERLEELSALVFGRWAALVKSGLPA